MTAEKDRILAALNPSAPLPEADGEVVADLIFPHEAWQVAGHFYGTREEAQKAADSHGLWAEPKQPRAWVPASALVSALRERDEALEAHKAALDLAMKRDGQLVTAIAAREKAEQVVAGMREALETASSRFRLCAQYIESSANASVPGTLRIERAIYAQQCAVEVLAALRASTEEGKTATPSVTEEEAGENELDRLYELASSADPIFHDAVAARWLRDVGAMRPIARAARRLSTSKEAGR